MRIAGRVDDQAAIVGLINKDQNVVRSGRQQIGTVLDWANYHRNNERTLPLVDNNEGEQVTAS